MRKVKHLLLNACLVLGSVAATVVAFEVAFLGYKERYSAWEDHGLFRLHKQRIYTMAPDYTGIWETAEFSVTLSSNGDGLRGPELRQGSPTWTRVLVLGDSFTYGHGVSNNESYPARLADLFSRHGYDVEVVNAGVNGYGTDQQHAYYTEELFLLDPDVIVLGLNWNDLVDNIGRPLYTIADGKLLGMDATKNSLYFISNLHRQSPKWLRSSHLFNYLLLGMRDKDLFRQLPDLDQQGLMKWSEEKIFLSLLDLKSLSEKRGSEFVVITMPQRERQYAYSFIEPFLIEQDIPHLDLSADLVWTQQASGLWYEVDGHPNIAGYARIAQSVYQFLISNTIEGKSLDSASQSASGARP